MLTSTSQMENPAVIGTRPMACQTRLVDRVEETRRECRRFLLLRALLWSILTLLAVEGLLALADYQWVLGTTIRQANWMLVGAIAAVLVVRRIVVGRRAAFDWIDTAAEIETAFPDLGQRVCTTIEYAEPKPNTMPAWPSLIRALTTETEERTYRLDFKQVIPWRRLRWPAAAAISLAAIFVLAIAISPAARIAAMRLFLIPVHYTQLQVEPGDQAVKFGGDVKIRAILSGRPVNQAELLSRKAGSDDPWTAVSLVSDDSQDAKLTGTLETSIKKCREKLEYRVTADAVESETYLLTIIHPLALKKIEATIEPPAYTRKKPSTVKEGDLKVIEGSAVQFRFELDRAAQTASLGLALAGKGKNVPAKPMPPLPLSVHGKMLEGSLANVTQDLVYEIQAESADGMKLDPRQFHISVQPDCKPSIRFEKPSPTVEALPTTEVTMQVASKDDFGLAKVGIVFQIGDGPKETLLLDQNPEQPVSLTSLATLYLEKHKLNFQDGIVYYAFVVDNYPSEPHQVTSDLQFIDIRAFKREFYPSRPGKSDKSVTLEMLIARQRTNLQHTFSQCREPNVDARIAKRLVRAEKSLAKLTKEFHEKLAERVGWVPCLEKAVEEMQAAVSELERKDMKTACAKEESALALLIQARRDLAWLLANPKSSGEMEKLDYQAQRNMPEPPEDDEEAEEQEENLQNQIEELAKTEEEIAEELEGKSGSSSSNSQSPKNSEKQSPSESKSQKGGQSQSGGQPQAGEQAQKGEQSQKGEPSQAGEPSQEDGQSPGKSLEERQQEAVRKAAEIAEKMEADDSMTDLAEDRIADAQHAIASSAKALKQGNKSEAGQKARQAAEQLDRLAKHVAGLKAAELGEKLKASERLARELAKAQRDAEKSENPGNSEEGEEGKEKGKGEGEGEGESKEQSQSEGKGEGEGESKEQSQSEGKGEGQGESKEQSQSKGQGKGKGQGEGEGQGEGDGQKEGNSPSKRLVDQQRADAEEARTLEDFVNEIQKDASLADPELVNALKEAAEANSPKEIAERMERAAKALAEGDKEKASREIGESAKKLEALSEQLDLARRSFLEPKLEALIEAEKQASEIQKKLNSPVSEQEKNQLEKKIADLHKSLNPLRGTDGDLRDETNALGDAMQTIFSGRAAWRRSGQGYFEPPKLYASSIERVIHVLQVKIQEIILKDAILDQDQPVPEQYRKQVEEYYKTLSEDLR